MSGDVPEPYPLLQISHETGLTPVQVDQFKAEMAAIFADPRLRHKHIVLPSAEVTHACPPDGPQGVMPCCGRTPFEVSHLDRMTVHGDMVTCPGLPEEAVDG